MKKITYQILFSAILIFLGAADTRIYAQDYEFRHITTRSGLPSGYINQIEQDSMGFMWFATESGLSKYDGYTFINYQEDEEDPDAIRSSNTYWLRLLGDEKILVGHLAGMDILHVDENRFSPILVSPDLPAVNTARAVLFDEQGAMWVGDYGHLFHFEEPDFADTLRGDSYAFSGLDILSLAEFRDQIWVGTSQGLFVFDRSDKQLTAIRPDDVLARQAATSEVWEITNGPDGNLYISTINGLLKVTAGTGEVTFVSGISNYTDQELIGFNFQDMMVDSDDNLWLGGSFYGAIKWDLDKNTFTEFRADENNANTVNSPDIHYIFEDVEGNMWFGYHYLGASIMYNDSWNYTLKKPFPELPADDPQNTILEVFTDDEGIIWATAANGLIRDLGGQNQAYFSLDDSNFSVPEDINLLQTMINYDDDEIYLTAASSPNALAPYIVVFDRKSLTFRIINEAAAVDIVTRKSIKVNETIYGGLVDRRAFMKMNLDTDEFEEISVPVEQIYSDATLVVTAIEYLNGDDLYVKVYNLGLPESGIIQHYIYDISTGEFRTHDITIDFPINGLQPPLRSVVEPGVTYINSTKGLIRVDNLSNSYSVLFEDEMMPLRETIRTMTQDEEGYIWQHNNEGIIRIDPLTETIDYFVLAPDKYRPWYALPSTLPDGDIIFAGINSYVRFDPSDLEGTQGSNRTIITSLQAGSEVLELTYSSEEPEIKSDQSALTFSFIGLNFKNPSSLNYRYRMLGSENDQWISVGTQRSVFIPNLKAGEYTFEVQSGSQAGTFNEASASLTFSVLPPWWNTIPAYLLYAILFVSAVIFVDRLQRSRLVRNERERAREKELEQAKEIEKAYENLKAAKEQLVQQEKLASLGQLTAGIAHEIKNPLNFVNNFSDVSMELIGELRDAVRAYRDTPLPNTDPALISDLLDDIEANLKTIHKHGTRADSIVKSMLQHSRGGTGEMEPNDLNALISEYVNLAFHGMRAGKNPINVDIQTELDENIGKIPLIAEDFSRVIVNLVNNAFDAMRDKGIQNSKFKIQNYSPKLVVRTRKVDAGSVVIEIEDNGPGIPDDMKDKVLEPFYTTKKGTEGTGLGLSITHDIINLHGGKVEIESEEGTKTIFRITLNV